MNLPLSARKKLLVIYNPKAGAQRNIFDATLSRLRDLGVAVVVRETTGPGSARDLARSATETGGYDAVIAAGGDGTVNETVNGLSGHPIPYGIIPIGTANVLALEIGLAQDAETVARTLVEGPVRAIVPGVINGRLFLLMVGAGWDGRLVAHTTTRLKRLFGKFAFLGHALQLLWQNRVPRLRVVAEGTRHPASWVIVSNVARYAGSFLLAPEERLERAGFTLVLFNRQTRLGFLRDLVSLALGKIERADSIQSMRVAEVVIEGDPSEPVQADGDFVGYLPARITLANHSLNLIVPANRCAPTGMRPLGIQRHV